MEMCFHGNQHPWAIKHPFISLYFKYQSIRFICLNFKYQPLKYIFLPVMNSPVFLSLDDIYCMVRVNCAKAIAKPLTKPQISFFLRRPFEPKRIPSFWSAQFYIGQFLWCNFFGLFLLLQFKVNVFLNISQHFSTFLNNKSFSILPAFSSTTTRSAIGPFAHPSVCVFLRISMFYMHMSSRTKIPT